MPGYPRTDLGEGFVRSEDLLLELRGDIDRAYAALELDRSSQYLRRCVVRAIFSFIEATVECIKVEIRSTVRIEEASFIMSEAEKDTLGALHVIGPRQDKLIALDQNVKRTFRLAAKIWQLNDFRLKTGGEDFQEFLRAKSARNRLTHPKTFYDIEVNDEDMRYHTMAGMWIQEEFQRLFDLRIKCLRAAAANG